MPPSSRPWHASRRDATANGIARPRATGVIAPRPPHVWNTLGDTAIHAHRATPTIPLPVSSRQGGHPETATGRSKKTEEKSLFNSAQARVGASAPSASVFTITNTTNAKGPSCGTARTEQPGKSNAEGWSALGALLCVSTGNFPGAVSPRSTTSGTSAPDAEKQDTEPRHALEQRRCEAISPYAKSGFDLGIPRIHTTFTPVPPCPPQLASVMLCALPVDQLFTCYESKLCHITSQDTTSQN